MSHDEKKVDVVDKENYLSQREQVSVTHGDYDEPVQEESLHRGLKARQISMIAVGLSINRCVTVCLTCHSQMGGAVGTGLIIGSGTALRRGGPLGIVV